jgi:hypothetical protein
VEHGAAIARASEPSLKRIARLEPSEAAARRWLASILNDEPASAAAA